MIPNLSTQTTEIPKNIKTKLLEANCRGNVRLVSGVGGLPVQISALFSANYGNGLIISYACGLFHTS